jgi:hypothetical protein
MDPFDMLLRDAGWEFEIHHNGGVSVHRGLKTREKQGGRNEFVGFSSEVAVDSGDLLVCKVTGDEYQVARTQKLVFMGKLSHIKAYIDTPYAPRPSHVSFNIGTMTNSAIQSHSPGAVQSLTFTQQNRESAIEIIEALRSRLPQLAFSADDEQDIIAELETAESQLKRSSPRGNVIRECFASVKDKIEEHIAGAIAGSAVTAGQSLLQLIGGYLAGQ